MIGAPFERVLAGAMTGDERCFALLWRDLQPALLRYLRVVAQGAADDVASETWLDVVQTLGRFRGDEQGFRAWVFTIARHRALDWQRRTIRQQATAVPTEALSYRAAADDPAASAMEALSTEAALALLAGLPQAQAEVVLLRVVAGLDVTQVARIVGKRPGAVRVLAHRGLRRLAEQLADREPERRGVTP
jgi:RNA polymerase sigma-70 factor (ECF subfamily)